MISLSGQAQRKRHLFSFYLDTLVIIEVGKLINEFYGLQWVTNSLRLLTKRFIQ